MRDSLRPPSLEALQADVGAVRIVLVGPGQPKHEPFRELLEGLRTDLQENTTTSREVLDEVRQLRTDVEARTSATREVFEELKQLRANVQMQPTASLEVVARLDKLTTEVGMIQDAFRKLPAYLSDAFSEALESELIQATPSAFRAFH
jgi:predicted nuclease with TOPRIM domain